MSTQKEPLGLPDLICESINLQVKEMSKPPMKLPDLRHNLTSAYFKEIEKTYNVSKSKADTDNAIDLLYIAYNATPIKHSILRNQINDIMRDLIKVQQKSAQVMQKAVLTSDRISIGLIDTFECWEEVLKGQKKEEIDDFLKEDIVAMADDIKEKAENLSKELGKVALEYDKILQKTQLVSNDSETALKDEELAATAILAEIKKTQAEQKSLQSITADLAESIAKYSAKERAFEAQATKAEDRAFITSIIGSFTSIFSSVAPAIGAGLSARGSGAKALKPESSEPTTPTQDGATTGKQEVDLKTEKNTKEAEETDLLKEKNDLETEAKRLSTEKKKIEAAPESDAGVGQLREIDNQIKENDTNAVKNKNRLDVVQTAIKAATEGLSALKAAMEKTTKDLQDQGASMRTLQMEMLALVTKYETEKRKINGELASITVLLSAQESAENAIKLTVKSLVMSITALKRMYEIVTEIQTFFDSFANYMLGVMGAAEAESAKISSYDGKKKSYALPPLIRSVTGLFIRQSGQWLAIKRVSSIFSQNFANGASTLNELLGNYLSGTELENYLKAAKGRIEEIVNQRGRDSMAKQGEAEEFIRQLEEQAKKVAIK